MKLNINSLKRTLNVVGDGLKRNSPTILTALGVVGLGASLVMTVKSTLHAKELIEDAEFKKGSVLTKEEVVKTAWKAYIPPVITATITGAAIIGINSTHKKRYTALAGLYTMSETALKDYQDQVLSEIGPKKAEKIKGDIIQNKLDDNPLSNNEIIKTGHGSTLCYDVLSGRYFESDIEFLKEARNSFNHKLITGSPLWLSVNDFYAEINLSPIWLGQQYGWSPDDLMELYEDSKLADNGDPCYVLDFSVRPRFFRT